VVGNLSPTTDASGNLQADLAQDGKMETFRSCSSNDGVNLTVWSTKPLDGILVWHGFYYEASNTAPGPPCTPKEVTAQ